MGKNEGARLSTAGGVQGARWPAQGEPSRQFLGDGVTVPGITPAGTVSSASWVRNVHLNET